MTGSAASPSAGGHPEWADTLDAYRDGVRVLQRLGSKFVDWSLPITHGGYSAVTLAGHLLCTARRHHRLLDAALAGRPQVDLPVGADLDVANAAEVATLGVTAGSDRIVAFDAIATRYAERLAETDPELVIGVWQERGALDVATHAREAAADWHLHAWDLADALGWDYRPARPSTLVDGRPTGRHGRSTDHHGRPTHHHEAPADHEARGSDPWTELLAASGRRQPDGPRPFGP